MKIKSLVFEENTIDNQYKSCSKIIVSYQNEEYTLQFDSDELESFFTCEAPHKGTKHLINLVDFLHTIEKFLDSRIELGWSYKFYQVQLRHTIIDGIIHVGYGLDDKVYCSGHCQIFENVENRWHLSHIEQEGEVYTLQFHGKLVQAESVSFKIHSSVLTSKVFNKHENFKFNEGKNYKKLITFFNNETSIGYDNTQFNNIKLRFCKASNVICQQFKQRHFPTTLTKENWASFFDDPQNFTISQMQSNLLTEE